MQSPSEALAILLVEPSDEDAELAIRVLLKSKLTKEIVRLRDAAEAEDYLYCRGVFAERPAEPPQWVLMDWSMPLRSGMDVLRDIKNSPSMKDMHVVILLSSPGEQQFLERDNLIADGYLVKPIQLSALRDLALKFERE